MMRNPPDRDALAAAAVDCLLCFRDPEADPSTKRRWQAWLAENPAHRRAFAACQKIWSVQAASDIPWPTADELAADPDRDDEPLSRPGPATAQAPRAGTTIRVGAYSRVRRMLSGSGAMVVTASLLVAAIIATELRAPREPGTTPTQVTTARGEQKQLRFPDGSSVLLGPESRIEVRLLPTERIVHLRSGEAIFTVAHDAQRSFRVFAGSGWVDDIGTAFSVRTSEHGVTVTVVQGAVSVTSSEPAGGNEPQPSEASRHLARLTQNEQVTYRETLGPVHAVDAAIATAWRNGKLAYIDQPLRDVVADLQRYSPMDIVVQDRSIEELRYTGTISIGTIDHWAEGLARVYPIQIKHQGNQLILVSKDSAR